MFPTWIARSLKIRSKRITKQIAKTSDSIRKKYRVLKTDKMEEDHIERHFKFIIESLKQVVENTISEPVKDPIKNEMFFSEKKEEY